jgi:PAS domain S-box-containing protein
VSDHETESLRPDIPEGLEGVTALLELARAFAPDFQLPTLAAEPPQGPASTPTDARMRKAEARYQTLVEQIPAVTFMASFENGLSEIYVSPHIETMLGYTAREWIDDPILWYQRLHPDDKQRWNQEFSRTVSWAEPFKADYRFLAKDGSTVWIHGEAKVVRDERGQPSFVQGIGYDITELKRAEEVLQRSREELERLVTERTAELAKANQALHAEITERKVIEAELERTRDSALVAARQKAEFLANMSHEIRTPMNGVIGMTELLLNSPLQEQQRDFAETIRASAEVLLTIINDILDFSKIEAGKLTFETLDFNLRECVESAIELLAARAHSKGLELAIVFDPSAPVLVRGDSGRLSQVLINLVGNAIKFTADGEVVVMVSKGQEAERRCDVRFEVKDTGIGIADDAQTRLFQAFSQADSSTTRKYGGTGLGLAISKQLVTLMDGQIGVKSAPGKGSTFWFTLPIEKQTYTETERISRDHLAGVRVLVVDDNATNRKILHHQLRAWRMIEVTASGGAEALRLLRAASVAARFDIAILDMHMPEMDGLTLARYIKADPSIAPTRLIVLSSIGQRSHPDEWHADDIEAWLTKPVRQARLFECLSAIVRTMKLGAAPSARVPVAIPATPARMHEARILIAEDNPINQKVAVGQLRTLGYAADTVADGREVLEALEMLTYDVILMDCQMPEMDGYEATRRIRAMEAEVLRPKAKLYIIAMTANAMRGDREKCLAAGMDDYISKPVRAGDLQAALERWKTAAALPAALLTRPGDESDVLDETTLDELRKMPGEDGVSMLDRLIDMILEAGPSHIAEIREASSDPAKLIRAAHLFKGVCLSVGAARVAKVCQELDALAKSGDLGAVESAVCLLEEAFEHTRAAFLRLRTPPAQAD